jgi:hypothetical protein
MLSVVAQTAKAHGERRLRPIFVGAFAVGLVLALAACGTEPTSATKTSTTFAPTTTTSAPADPGYRPNVPPGVSPIVDSHDVYPLTPREPFLARPDFKLMEGCGQRPCWLKLYASPDEASAVVNDNWPYENGFGHQYGDYLQVVCQTRGTTVMDENGSTSNIWNRVIARADKVPAAAQPLLQPAQGSPGFYAYAPDLLLGNSGDHQLPC